MQIYKPWNDQSVGMIDHLDSLKTGWKFLINAFRDTIVADKICIFTDDQILDNYYGSW